MIDYLLCPHIVWKVDLRALDSFSKTYSRFMNFLKSLWRLKIEADERNETLRIYLIPKIQEYYSHMNFMVKCGVRDRYGILKFDTLHLVTSEFLRKSFIWEGMISELEDENLIQDNLLWVICTIEPQSKWEVCKNLTDPPDSRLLYKDPCTDNLIRNFQFLFDESVNFDVILKCENETIRAHRSVLSCRSKVFDAMFNSSMKENLEGKVVIKDISFHVFEKLIRYIYTAEIDIIDVAIACEIYEAANLYFVDSLTERCQSYFVNTLFGSFYSGNSIAKVENACKVLCLAHRYSDNYLKNLIQANLAQPHLLETAYWKHFSYLYPELALEVYFKLLHTLETDF